LRKNEEESFVELVVDPIIFGIYISSMVDKILNNTKMTDSGRIM